MESRLVQEGAITRFKRRKEGRKGLIQKSKATRQEGLKEIVCPQKVFPTMSVVTYGFIGLGLMGLPMCHNLAQNSQPADRIRVFDLVESVLDQIVNDHPDKIIRCSSAQGVAEGAVSPRCRFCEASLTL